MQFLYDHLFDKLIIVGIFLLSLMIVIKLSKIKDLYVLYNILICLILIIIVLTVILSIFEYFSNRTNIERDEKIKTDMDDSFTKTWIDMSKNYKGKLTDIPWILLIGESGSGKTTSLSEVKYFDNIYGELKNEKTKIGESTHNFNWFVGERLGKDALLFDLAGELAIGKGDDRIEDWDSLLKKIKNNRPRCPINSIILTIPTTSLLGIPAPKEDDESSRKKKAKQIYSRLKSIYNELEINVPIYIMISKLDLLYGFREFSLFIKDQDQDDILGFECNLDNIFDEFDNYINRLYSWILRRISLETNETIDLIYVIKFLEELIKIKDPLINDYVKNIIENHQKDHIKEKPKKIFELTACFFTTSIQPDQDTVNDIRQNKVSIEEINKKLQEATEHKISYFQYKLYDKVITESNKVEWTEEAKASENKYYLGSFLILFIGVFYLLSITNTVEYVTGSIENIEDIYSSNRGNTVSNKGVTTNNCYFEPIGTAKDIQESVNKISNEIQNSKNLISDSWLLSLPYFFDHYFSKTSIVKDLRKIEALLVIKGLVFPVIFVTAKEICYGRNQIENNTAKEICYGRNQIENKIEILNRLKVYISLFSDLSINNYLEEFKFHESFRKFENTEGSFLKGYSHHQFKELIEKYSQDIVQLELPCKGELLFYIRIGLAKVYEYWRCSEKEIENMGVEIDNFLSLYDNFLETKDINNVNEKFNAIINYIDVLNTNYIKDKIVLLPKDIQDMCEKDYESLNSIIKNKKITNEVKNRWYFEKIENVLKKKTNICYEKFIYDELKITKNKCLIKKTPCTNIPINTDNLISQGIDKYDINAEDIINNSIGRNYSNTKSKEIYQPFIVKKVLTLARDFSNPVEKDKKNLCHHLEILFKNKKITQNNINKEINRCLLNALWKKDKLIYRINSFLDLTLCENANKLLAERINLLTKTKLSEKVLSSLKEIKSIKNCLRNFHDNKCKLYDTCNQKYIKIISYFVKQHIKRINEVNPYANFSNIEKWNDFVKYVKDKNYKYFVDPEKDLKDFMQDVKYDNLIQIRSIIKEDKIIDNSSINFLDSIIKTRKICDGKIKKSKDFLGVQEIFIENIKIHHFSKFFDKDKLTVFKKFCYDLLESELANETLSLNLKQIGDKAFKLYEMIDNSPKKIYTMNISKELSNLLSTWKNTLSDYYPFKEYSSSSYPKNEKDIKDFFTTIELFFTEQCKISDYRSFIRRSDNSLTRKQKKFLDNILKWQDFLFTETDSSKEHSISIHMITDKKFNVEFGIDENQYIGDKFNIIRIEGLSDSGSAIKFEVSGNNKQNTTNWELSSKPVHIKATSWNTDGFSFFIKGCNLSLIGYFQANKREISQEILRKINETLKKTNKRQHISQDWRIFILDMHDERDNNINVKIPLMFYIKDKIPDIIDWP